MKINDPKHLTLLVEEAGNALRALSIQRTGMFRFEAKKFDKVSFLRPPLWTGFRVAGVDFTSLGPSLYRREIDVQAVLDTFMECMLHERGMSDLELRRHLHSLMPDITMARHIPALACLIQAMYLCGLNDDPEVWSKFTTSSAALTTPSGRYVIHRQAMEGGKQYRIAKQPLPFNVFHLLSTGLSGMKRSSNRLGALYRYLLTLLPSQHQPLQALFSAIVHAGPEYEKLMLRCFDMKFVSKHKTHDDVQVWDQCIRKLSAGLKRMPYDWLRKRLDGHLTPAEFRTTFSTRSMWVGRTYTPDMALSHQRELCRLQQLKSEPTKQQAEASELQTALDLIRHIR